ncbi:lysosome membrane protein 2c isoform X2 [Gadus macrocephalus]|uniref:lysosome membrane protein 2c isoform X2 n=1 Tax=Gadus macrocephalus TaxID=80720 RepID=UPI0028CB9B2A|nr:lysosome membrane protein 2c isoform X2 [Gadus macrocephalus]
MLRSCCAYSLGLFSILILIAGISLVLSSVFPNVLNSRVKKEVVLKNGTDSFEAWKNPPPPVYMQFYFFNLTNPLEVLDGDRPAVIERGPYTYREYRPMEEVDFLENGTKVSAVNPKTYIFQANMSIGPESDLIRTVNIPAVTVMEKFKGSLLANLISAFMVSSGEGLFTTRTVGELLWGYEDAFLKAAKTIIPELDDMFGLFYKANATDDGQYVFFTGETNYTDFARVDAWKNKRQLDWWTSPQCNMINGTNGAFFHPLVTKDETLYMFSSDLCRSMYATYVEDVTVKELPGYRFSPPSSVFANLTVNPDNAGFCVPEGNCLGSGVLNVSACKQGECGPPVLYRCCGPGTGPGAERRLNGALPPQLKHYAPLVFFSIFPVTQSAPSVIPTRWLSLSASFTQLYASMITQSYTFFGLIYLDGSFKVM